MEKTMMQLYEEDRLSCRQIAEKLGLTRGYVNYHLKSRGAVMRTIREGIQTRYPNGRPTGKDAHHWKGGTTVGSVGGKYIMRQCPDHPHANNHGYVMEHRLVMEEKLGRYLEKNEIVHHVNDDPRDNRPENLEVISRSQHVHNHFAKGKYVMALEERIRKLEEEVKRLKSRIELGWESTL